MQVREVQNAPSIGSLLRVKIIGSGNGLLLVQIDNDKYGTSPTSLLLWNPAIREVRHVPKTIDGFEGDCYIGFGFSPILNDYKIVRIYTEFSGVVNRVEVYSLNTGSWKELEFGKLEGVYLSVETVTINGAMFWDGLLELGVKEGDEDDIDVIVSFEMALEVFSLIPRPPFHSNTSVKFIAYENKLAIPVDSGIENFTYSLIDLWVMEEGIGTSGERWGRSKKYTSGLCPYSLFPRTIWRNEIVCNAFGMPRPISKTKREMDNDEPKAGIFLFDLTSNKLKVIANSRFDLFHHIFNYVESLVPVENIYIEEP